MNALLIKTQSAKLTEAADTFARLNDELRTIEKQRDAAKAVILEAKRDVIVTSAGRRLTIDTQERTSIDMARLQALHPSVYVECQRTTTFKTVRVSK